jgi:hypothetical protein
MKVQESLMLILNILKHMYFIFTFLKIQQISNRFKHQDQPIEDHSDVFTPS